MNARARVAAAAAALGALLALVGGIALVASYWHARALAHLYRTPVDTVPDLSAWLPLTTDGLLAGAFAVIYWRRVAAMDVPRLAWAGAGLAGAGTVAANLATAHPSVTGWIIAGWAPVTFTFVDFLVAILIPPLVAAWRDTRDTRDDTAWPHLPTFPDDSPGLQESIARANRAVSTLRPRDDVTVEPGTESFEHVTEWSGALPELNKTETVDVPTGAYRVSTLRHRDDVTDPVPDSDDEAVARLQAEIDGGADLPKARHLRDRWGFNAAKAKRIIDRLDGRAS